MPAFRSILVAADFSEASRHAFHTAVALGREDKTRLFVLHVLDPRPAAAAAPELSAAREAVRERLRREYVPAHPIDTEYRVAEAGAAEQIVRTSDELGCDLIVMGTHGRTALSRLLAGSVAEAVLRQSRCPVLVLRSPVGVGSAEPGTPGSAAAAGAAGSPGFQCILHPTDFSLGSETALRVARELAREQGSRLVLLHVIPVEAYPSEVPPLPIDREPYRVALAERQIRVEGPDLKGSVESMLREGDVADQILRTAEECRCDVIVMGTHGRSGLGRLLMGSAAEAVIRRSPCPVLAVRNPPPSA